MLSLSLLRAHTAKAFAVKLGGTGDITPDRLWLHPKATQRVGSGMVIGDHAYIVEESGVPHCYELTTGEEVWQVKKRPNGGKTWGSMVHANNRLYVLMKNGSTLVFADRLGLITQKILLKTFGGILPPIGEKLLSNAFLAVALGDVLLFLFFCLVCSIQSWLFSN